MLDYVYAGKLSLLVGKLTDGPLLLDLKDHIAYLKLISVEKVNYLSSCGSLQDIVHANADIISSRPSISEGLAPNEHAAAKSLLKKVFNPFSTGLMIFYYSRALKTISTYSTLAHYGLNHNANLNQRGQSGQ